MQRQLLCHGLLLLWHGMLLLCHGLLQKQLLCHGLLCHGLLQKQLLWQGLMLWQGLLCHGLLQKQLLWQGLMLWQGLILGRPYHIQIRLRSRSDEVVATAQVSYVPDMVFALTRSR
jgi:hypothetical protein